LASAAICSIVVAAVARPALGGNLLGHTAGTTQTVTFNKSNLTAQMSGAFNYNDFMSIEFSDINTMIYTNDGPREVNVNDQTFSAADWYGRWTCNEWNAAQDVCVKGTVNINLKYAYTDDEAKSVMCEEIGHSVGLDHRETTDNTCMARPVCWTCKILHNHEITHLNSLY
jgi:hypothetical protein